VSPPAAGHARLEALVAELTACEGVQLL